MFCFLTLVLSKCCYIILSSSDLQQEIKWLYQNRMSVKTFVEKSAWDLLQIVSPYASNSGSVVAAVA